MVPSKDSCKKSFSWFFKPSIDLKREFDADSEFVSEQKISRKKRTN